MSRRAKGWGGIAFQNVPMIASMLSQPAAAHETRVHHLFDSSIRSAATSLPKFRLGRSVTPSKPSPRTEQDVLINILALQMAQGGFEIDKEISRRIGVTIAELKKLSGKIKSVEKADMFVLLSTAVILELLEKYYSDREDEWEDLVEKTEKWLKDEILRAQPKIEGITLEDWAAQFIRTLRFQV